MTTKQQARIFSKFKMFFEKKNIFALWKLWTLLCCQLWTMLCCTTWTMLSTRLFSHDDNVVKALFNHQCCYNLSTRLSNNDNNNEQAYSINTVFSCLNNREQPRWNNIIVNNIVHWTALFSHNNCVVTVLFNQQWQFVLILPV